MKVEVIEDINIDEIKVTILCKSKTQYVSELEKRLMSAGISINGKLDDQYFRIEADQIYYIESVDNRTYIYCRNDIYECSMKIYEIERLLEDTDCIRINKSTILNISKLNSVKGKINGRMIATLKNGEKVIINRTYVQAVKKKLNLKARKGEFNEKDK